MCLTLNVCCCVEQVNVQNLSWRVMWCYLTLLYWKIIFLMNLMSRWSVLKAMRWKMALTPSHVPMVYGANRSWPVKVNQLCFIMFQFIIMLQFFWVDSCNSSAAFATPELLWSFAVTVYCCEGNSQIITLLILCWCQQLSYPITFLNRTPKCTLKHY